MVRNLFFKLSSLQKRYYFRGNDTAVKLRWLLFKQLSFFQKGILSFVLYLLVSSALATPSKYNMPPGVTPLSRDIYHLHMTIFWICVAIGVIVFSVLIYSLIMHRKSCGAVAEKFHEHTAVEVTWAIIPFIILVVMAIPATKVLIAMNDTSASAMTIKITGYQWKWRYQYLDQGIDFFSVLTTPLEQIHNKQQKDRWYLLEVDNQLVVPINRKIRLLVTANDVVHSWWVPELGVKRDGIPGFIHDSWIEVEKPGIYRGQCAELCGVNHGFMPIVVKAVTPSEFEQWVKSKKGGVTTAAVTQPSPLPQKKFTNLQEAMQQGKPIYEKYCGACHKEDGTGIEHLFPGLKGSSVSTGRPVSRHIQIILQGRPGTAMQAFASQLNDGEIAAITTYERNAWGNNTGDIVQATDVETVRKGGQQQ